MEKFNLLFSEDQTYILKAFLTIFIISFFILLRKFTLKTLKKKARHNIYDSWKKNSIYLTTALLLFSLLLVWLPHIRGFFTLFSIIGTGLVVALKEVFLNLAGWIYIITRRPFEVGNRIMITNFIGDVIDIRPFEFSMIEVKPREEGGQSTGRIFRVPNALLLTQPLANSSKEFSFYWNEIKIPLTSESDWSAAVTTIEKVASSSLDHVLDTDDRIKRAERKHKIHYSRLDFKTYVEYKDEGIIITLRHLSEPRKTREITDRFWRSVLPEFKKQKNIHLL